MRTGPIRGRVVAAVIFALLCGGCASPAYYWQAASGQLELWRRARPLAELQADPAVAAELRARLATAATIRNFAVEQLGLPDNGSYRRYAELNRRYVVWNVFAAETLSIRPKEWCFPIAGCVSYRGYFAEADARAYAAALEADGLEVHVTGVPAYSTLGWFDDPLLSTFIRYPETELARLIFHELAHQVVYVPGDTEFNESFAVAVEVEGVRRWLDRRADPHLSSAFDRAQVVRADFADLVVRYRTRLADIYASDQDRQSKLANKERLIAELEAEYQRIKRERWAGYAGYDPWFGQRINNATLSSIGLYSALVPQFTALLARQGKDLSRFYAAVKKLADRSPAERRRALGAPSGDVIAVRDETPGGRVPGGNKLGYALTADVSDTTFSRAE